MMELLNEYSLEIYDAVKNNKLSISKLYTILKNKNKKEILSLRKLNDKKKEELAKNLDKYEILDDLLYVTNDKYKHLKETRYLINLDKFIDYVFIDDIFYDKLRLYYTNLLIDKILDKYYDIDDIKFLSKLKKELIDIEKVINNSICYRIDEYYIKLITN